jgi:hypothetical protein
MKKETKAEPELIFDIEIGEGVNVFAFCGDCSLVIYKGGDSTPMEHRILRDRLLEHLDDTDWDHEIDVIYPKRKTDNCIDAQIYLATGVKLTIEAEKRHQSRSM